MCIVNCIHVLYGHSKETVPFVPKICRIDIFCKLVKDEHSIVYATDLLHTQMSLSKHLWNYLCANSN